MARKRVQRTGGGATNKFFGPAATASATVGATARVPMGAFSQADVGASALSLAGGLTLRETAGGHTSSAATINPHSSLTRSFVRNGFMALEAQRCGREIDAAPLATWMDSRVPKHGALPWDRPAQADATIPVSTRALARTRGQASTLSAGHTVASLASLRSTDHLLVEGTRGRRSFVTSTGYLGATAFGGGGGGGLGGGGPSWRPEGSGTRTGRSVAPLVSGSSTAVPVRGHGRARAGGPVRPGSQGNLERAYGEARPTEPPHTRLIDRLVGGVCSNEVSSVVRGRGEMEVRRELPPSIPTIDPSELTAIPFLAQDPAAAGHAAAARGGAGPPSSKFKPANPPGLPAFETLALRTGRGVGDRPPRGAVQAQREEGVGAGAGFVGYSQAMNLGSTISHAERGTSLFAERSEMYRTSQPHGRAAVDPATLPPAVDKRRVIDRAGGVFARREALQNRHEALFAEEAERQLCFAQVSMINHRAAQERYAHRVARQPDRNRAAFAGGDPGVRYAEGLPVCHRGGVHKPFPFRVPYGHDPTLKFGESV